MKSRLALVSILLAISLRDARKSGGPNVTVTCRRLRTNRPEPVAATIIRPWTVASSADRSAPA
jgi:hypothetical protein